jgi:hypothetical protein
MIMPRTYVTNGPPRGVECGAFPVFRLNPAVTSRSDGNHGNHQPVLGTLRKIQFVSKRVLLLERPPSECNIRNCWLFTEILTRHTHTKRGRNNVVRF